MCATEICDPHGSFSSSSMRLHARHGFTASTASLHFGQQIPGARPLTGTTSGETLFRGLLRHSWVACPCYTTPPGDLKTGFNLH